MTGCTAPTSSRPSNTPAFALITGTPLCQDPGGPNDSVGHGNRRPKHGSSPARRDPRATKATHASVASLSNSSQKQVASIKRVRVPMPAPGHDSRSRHH